MDLGSIKSNGLSTGAETVSVDVERWSDNLRHHLRQQAVQIGQNNIDVPHDVTSITAARPYWTVKAVLLSDWEMGDLFVADSWRYTVDGDGEDVTVTYEGDNTDPRDQILDRVEDAVAEEIAEETKLEVDMLDLVNVRLNEHHDSVKFEL